MAEIGQLPPIDRVSPTRPGSKTGQGDRPPQRKPDNKDERQHDRRRQPEKDGDEISRIDEYA